MSRRQAAAILAASGLPVVHYEWPDGGTPTWPSILYQKAGDASFAADGDVYHRVDVWEAWLVMEGYDDAAVEALEGAFREAGVIPAQSMYIFDGEEGLGRIEYRFRLAR